MELQKVAGSTEAFAGWHTPLLHSQHSSYPALGTFSAAPHGVLAVLELRFLEPPSIPPPGVSCLKHGSLQAGAGVVNPSTSDGALRSQIKMGHGLNFLNLTSQYLDPK